MAELRVANGVTMPRTAWSGTGDSGGKGMAARSDWRETVVAYARGAGGGLFIALPLLMTMEMWWNGFYMPAWRMLLFFALNFGVLVILEHYSGFRDDSSFLEEIQDAVVALGIGVVVSAVVLLALSVLGPGMGAREIIGKITLEAIPVSIGASVAMSQLGVKSAEAEHRKDRAGFGGTEAVALAGAVLFGFTVAPTEEPMMLGLMLTPWHALVVLILSLVIVHGLVFAVEFRGTHSIPEGTSRLRAFFDRSLTSYAIALVVAAYLLWTFGRIDAHTGVAEALRMTLALGLATSLGAAAGKLIL
ncbi:MAG: TIGR02587 family membrane protein [Gemmatimonadota bacterium]|nr:TIGR02587 family membrane protein [Gemmatimonadota bacterium]